jgi:acetyltransferase-like isoleucine patch superfamily enzyme
MINSVNFGTHEVECSISVETALERRLLILGKGCQVAPTVRIVHCEDDGRFHGPIEIGDGAIVREFVVLCSGVHIGRHVLVGHHCVLRRLARIGDDSVLSHLVSVQHDVTIGTLVRVSSLTHLTGGCLIEDRVQIGAGVATIDDNALEWPNPTELKAPVFREGCRIGSGCSILSGVEIGRNTVIGAGSVVTRSMPENVVAFGNPAYIQRDRKPADPRKAE